MTLAENRRSFYPSPHLQYLIAEWNYCNGNAVCFSTADNVSSFLSRKCLCPHVHGLQYMRMRRDALVFTLMGKYSQHMTDIAINVNVDKDSMHSSLNRLEFYQAVVGVSLCKPSNPAVAFSIFYVCVSEVVECGGNHKFIHSVNSQMSFLFLENTLPPSSHKRCSFNFLYIFDEPYPTSIYAP